MKQSIYDLVNKPSNVSTGESRTPEYIMYTVPNYYHGLDQFIDLGICNTAVKNIVAKEVS
jgi:hypothetical protein